MKVAALDEVGCHMREVVVVVWRWACATWTKSRAWLEYRLERVVTRGRHARRWAVAVEADLESPREGVVVGIRPGRRQMTDMK